MIDILGRHGPKKLPSPKGSCGLVVDLVEMNFHYVVMGPGRQIRKPGRPGLMEGSQTWSKKAGFAHLVRPGQALMGLSTALSARRRGIAAALTAVLARQ